jgi:hypothetical protein
MNFLEIVERLADETDVTRPTATTNQTGEARRLVQWVATAYRDICQRHRDWNFLRSTFSVPTVADTQAYAITACTDTDALSATMTVAGFSHWWPETFLIYLQSAGVATQGDLVWCDYEEFRYRWLRGSPSSSAPIEWTQRQRDKAILLGPKPSAVYIVTGDYQRLAPALDSDDDTPLFPAAYHELIVWEAYRKYMGFEEDGGGYEHANQERARLWADLERDQLPEIPLGAPLVC